MPFLERDQASTIYKGSIERVGRVPNAATPTWRIRLAGQIETLNVSTRDMRSPRRNDDGLILAQPGDLVSMTISRKFGLLVVSDFINDSLKD